MTKLTAMTDINNALQNTALHTARVWNPFPSLAEGPTAAFSANPDIDPKVPQLIADIMKFDDLRNNEKITFAASAKHNGLLSQDLEWTDLTEPIFTQLRNQLKINYLKRGYESIANFPSGICTMFACAVLGFLARNHHLLDNGSVVELVNYTGNQGGHAFVVVNRAGTVNKVHSWGADCYTIDPWYARHRLTAPGANAVKDMRVGTNYSDPAFNQFLRDASSRKVQVTFTHMDLINTFI